MKAIELMTAAVDNKLLLCRDNLPNSVILVNSFVEIQTKLGDISEDIDRVFIIGGSSVYKVSAGIG